MVSSPSLKYVLLALAAALGSLATAQAVCKSDGGYACPAQDDIAPVLGPYDPASVDWNAVVADIYSITDAEPRVCTMAIRTWFHDLGAHERHGVDGDQRLEDLFPGFGGSDASIITHKDETLEFQNAFHGFAQVAKHVLVQLAAAHGASHADVLTVFAAKCIDRMHATIDIPSHCEAQRFPLYVGKQDYSRPTDHQNFPIHTARVNQLPQAHTRIPGLYDFFLNDMNDVMAEARWKLTQQDATALLGAHGMMQNQNCMTDGQQPGTPPGMTDRTCSGAGGIQRQFKWSNHYWQDVTSGVCRQTAFDNAGRSLNTQESVDFTQCSWKSLEGFALGERLECDAMEIAAQRLNAAPIPPGQAESNNLQFQKNRGDFSEGWKDALWRPDAANPPAPCCGYTCETCEEDPGSKFWCGGLIEDEGRFWPYGYMDCDWQRAHEEGSGYCDGQLGSMCTQHWPGQGPQIRSVMGNVRGLLDKYRGNADAWQEDFAVAFCKFSNFGANYTDSKTSFATLFSGATTGCLDVKAVLSPKQCPTCEIAGRDPSVMIDATPIESSPTQPVSPPADAAAAAAAAPTATAPESVPADAPTTTPTTTTTEVTSETPAPAAAEAQTTEVEATSEEPAVVEEAAKSAKKVAEPPQAGGTGTTTPTDTASSHSNLYQWLVSKGYITSRRLF